MVVMMKFIERMKTWYKFWGEKGSILFSSDLKPSILPLSYMTSLQEAGEKVGDLSGIEPRAPAD